MGQNLSLRLGFIIGRSNYAAGRLAEIGLLGIKNDLLTDEPRGSLNAYASELK